MYCERINNIYNKEAQLPTIQDKGDFLRIFFSFRINKESHINYIDVSKYDFKIIYENELPVLSPGGSGLFDDCGVMPSCIVDNFLYYTGWTLKSKTPYAHSIGLAVFDEDKNKFYRVNDGPILGINEDIPYLANSAFVNNDRLWFCNGTGWHSNIPTYHICSAILKNNKWIFDINFKPIGSKNEINSRPCISNSKLFFAKKKLNGYYQIYQDENLILDVSNNGWDSEMVCYPYLWENYIFYNGNGYGKTGIGVANVFF